MTSGFDTEILRYAQQCLLVQSICLNALWVILLAAWIASWQTAPTQTLGGGRPSGFHWLIAGFAWALTLGVSLHELEPEQWFLGLALANGAMLSTLNPAFATCFALGMLFLRPWELMPNNALALELPRFSMFFSLTWAAFYLIVVDRFSARINRILLILAGYAIWAFLSTLVTPNPSAARVFFNETIVRAVIVAVLIHHLIRDAFSLWTLRVSLVSILTGIGIVAIVLYSEGYREGGRVLAFGVFKNSNDIAAVMLVLIGLAAAPLFARGRGWLEKIVALLPITTGLAVIALAQSRGAVLSLGLAGGAHAFRKIKRKAVALMVLGTIVVGGYGATKVFNRETGDLEGSSRSRKSFWISGIRMAIYNPAFGVGFNRFPRNFERYATEIVGEYGKRTAHSSWILAFAESGIPGGLLFAAYYVFGALGNAVSISRIDPTWLYTAIAYGMAISFLSHTYMLVPYVLVALTTAAVTVYRKTGVLR